ncbi:MAG TPA: histidinol-phosphate transaminase [Firmicutes bacterium]|nr:histidinol-phosphate transaminase [Bacillota bacterium]
MTKEFKKRACLEPIIPYMPGKPIEEVERELGISDIIKMASNENPIGPSPRVMAAIIDYLPKLSLYPDGSAYYLKQALAARLGVAEQNIICGNGADELITFSGMTYLNPGDEIIICNPTFSEYEFTARVMDAVPVRVPSANFGHDLPAMLAAVTPRTKIIYVCNPNNPTGTMLTHAELESFIKEVPPHILVVMDEAYHEYVTDPAYVRSIEFLHAGYNVFILRTFSKIYGLAGLRVGYGLASPEIIADINTVREPFNVNAVAQIAAQAALEDNGHLLAVREANTQGRAYLAQEFARMGLSYVPSQANFIFVEVGVEARALFQRLLQKGVIVRPGDIFGCPQHVRVSFGTAEQNRRFIRTLEETLREMV